jgi:hypothetical protein
MDLLSRPFLAVGALALGAVACSAQHDASYRGEPLARLQGTAETAGIAPPVPLDVALVWQQFGEAYNGPDGGWIENISKATSNAITVAGQFPSSFTLDVMTPPSDISLASCNSGSLSDPNTPPVAARVGRAEIDAVVHGSESGDHALEDSNRYGEAFEFEVVYLDQDASRCPMLTLMADGPLAKGYHLLRRIPGVCTPERMTFFGCQIMEEVPLSTPIDLIVKSAPIQDPQEIDISRAGLTGSTCVNAPLPTDPATGSACKFYLQSAGGSITVSSDGGVVTMPSVWNCNRPGLSPATPDDEAQIEHNQEENAICKVAQLPPTAWVNGSCEQSSQPGWCYKPAADGCSGGAVSFSSVTNVATGNNVGPVLFGYFLCP